jgi:hypothetical protein
VGGWLAFGWLLLTVVVGFLTVVILVGFGVQFAVFFLPLPVGALLLAVAILRGPSTRVLVVSGLFAGFLTAVGVGAFIRGSQALPWADAAVLGIAAATLVLSVRAVMLTRRGVTL